MNNQTQNLQIGPVEQKNRIQTLDVLRGMAVLGILMMNIQGLSMPAMAYVNPNIYGDFSGVNYAVWFIGHLLFDSKFISIFSMLFGAGIILMTSRVEARKNNPSSIYFRRIVVMALIGLVHAYLIWWGDILIRYAMCAVCLYWFRKLSPQKLFLLAIVLYLVYLGFTLDHGWHVYHLTGDALEAQINQGWVPPAEDNQYFLDVYRGGYIGQRALNNNFVFLLDVIIFLYQVQILKVGALMLLGMAFFKWGVLSGERILRFYRNLIVIGLSVGIPLTLLDIAVLHKTAWDYQAYSIICKPLYLFSAPLISLMFVSLIVLFVKSGKAQWITQGLSATGRMALTNYLMQSILCTLFFYGYGLGYYGHLERYQQFLFVIVIWIIQICYSVIWLRYFRFGPFEWLWRSLTYLSFQPFRR
jgi:uncharacterized protein